MLIAFTGGLITLVVANAAADAACSRYPTDAARIAAARSAPLVAVGTVTGIDRRTTGLQKGVEYTFALDTVYRGTTTKSVIVRVTTPTRSFTMGQRYFLAPAHIPGDPVAHFTDDDCSPTVGLTETSPDFLTAVATEFQGPSQLAAGAQSAQAAQAADTDPSEGPEVLLYVGGLIAAAVAAAAASARMTRRETPLRAPATRHTTTPAPRESHRKTDE